MKLQHIQRRRCAPMTRFAGVLLTVFAVAVLTSMTHAQTNVSTFDQFPGNNMFRIVSPEWVATHAGDEDVRILDVRTSVNEYQYGHVPNAIHLADVTMRGPQNGVPVQYLEPQEMASLFRRAGINRGDTVVVYSDGKDVLGATMMAYCLQRIGHQKVAILDGGFEAFRNTEALTQKYPDVRTGSISPTLQRDLFITYDELKKSMDQTGVTILDTRPVADYLGNTTRWMRNGHIPGALNLDWHQLMQPDNLHAFRPVDEMRRIVERTGISKNDKIIVYCGTSREATLVFHVMKGVLGYPNVRLYEGSWTEYCSKPDARVATGREKGMKSMAHAMPSGKAKLEPYECGTVTRLHVFGDIFLASQPSPEDFEQAAKNGIATVINQRHADETEFNEQRIVTNLGMQYYNIPWNGPDELTDEVFARTREMLRTAKRPILLHCSSANRTGTTWLAYRVLDTGASIDQALEEARTVGMRSPVYEQEALDYIRRMQRQR